MGKVLTIMVILFSAGNAWGGELILRDSECRLLGADGSEVKEVKADLSEYTCVTISGEATCSYKSPQSGTQHGEPTKFETATVGDLDVWSSATGNIKMFVNKRTNTFSYGMVANSMVGILTKLCAGTIIRRVG